jgi:hypothetical protein
VPQVQVWRSWIETGFNAKWSAGLKFFYQFSLDQKLVSPALDQGQLGIEVTHCAIPGWKL